MGADTDPNQATLTEDGYEAPDSVQNSLEKFGLETGVKQPRREEVEQASEFGIDDRENINADEVGDDSSQEKLFHDVDKDQQTLGGDEARQCKFSE